MTDNSRKYDWCIKDDNLSWYIHYSFTLKNIFKFAKSHSPDGSCLIICSFKYMYFKWIQILNIYLLDSDSNSEIIY